MNNMISLIDAMTDEDLIECFKKSKTLNELYSNIGYSRGSITQKNRLKVVNRLSILGYSTEDLKPKYGNKSPKFCLICGKPVKNLFCSPKCQSVYRQQNVVKHWKETGNTGCQPQTTLRNAIRTYIYEKQNYKCAICGIKNIWNGKLINFVLDHIDGNAANNKEENLRLICPNCNSQLDTYKSRNKKSARSHRKKYS